LETLRHFRRKGPKRAAFELLTTARFVMMMMMMMSLCFTTKLMNLFASVRNLEAASPV
jgi:hypothetical protein